MGDMIEETLEIPCTMKTAHKHLPVVQVIIDNEAGAIFSRTQCRRCDHWIGDKLIRFLETPQ